ncbi:MAG: hypothetical protein M0R80_17340 [Proteobacteria bacterium]|nr:hypothetical protein [Pseudomonadota bacterium]
MKRPIAWLVATSCAAAVTTAGVASSAQDEADPAKAAFGLGGELFDKGDYAAAADAFREANRLKPSWKLFYNIGQAEAAGRRYGLALEAFERYLIEGGDEIAADRNDEVIKIPGTVLNSLLILRFSQYRRAPPPVSLPLDSWESALPAP